MSVATAKEGMRDLAIKAKSIVEDASIPLSEKKLTLEKMSVDQKAFSDEISVDIQAKALMAGGEAAEVETQAVTQARGIKSLGEQIVESKSYLSAKGAGSVGARFGNSVDVKTINTVNEGSTISGGFLNGLAGAGVLPNYLPGVVDLKQPPLLIAQLFAQGTTDSPIVSYLKETVFQNSAAGTAEGGAKPQSDDTLARVTAQVGKISHFMRVTDEMFQDAPQLISFLNSRLVLGIQLKEQTELLSGSGAPSIGGVLNASGLQTAILANGTSQPIDIDAAFQMITQIRFNSWLEPDAIAVNPTDWQGIRLRKDSAGQYFGGGPFTGAYGNGGYTNVDSLWGVRVIITPAVPVKTMLVGAFHDAAQIFRRQGVTVEMTNSDASDFENGNIAVRADERLALAIYRPGAFGKVTLA